MRVIITEKPLMSQMLAKAVAAVYPDEEFFLIEAQPFWLNNFKFPRGLSLRDYPFFGNPIYKRDQPWGDLKRWLTRADKNGALRLKSVDMDMAREVMLQADEIICACDWDHTGMWGFDLFIEQTLGNERKSSYPVICLGGSYDEAKLIRSIRSMITTDHPDYKKMLEAGRVKRLFEYNYAVNSLCILGNLYRKIAGNQEPFFVSKYTLQVLIWMSKKAPMPIWKIDSFLAHKWVGTGKYARNQMQFLQGIGCAASRGSMIRVLVENGLAQQEDGGIVSITVLGHAYVQALHPDCSDADLPFRIDAWMSQGVEAAEPTIKRYLNTFFGKQLRYQEKSGLEQS